MDVFLANRHFQREFDPYLVLRSMAYLAFLCDNEEASSFHYLQFPLIVVMAVVRLPRKEPLFYQRTSIKCGLLSLLALFAFLLVSTCRRTVRF